MIRAHNDANMMTLGAHVVGEGQTLEVVDTFSLRQIGTVSRYWPLLSYGRSKAFTAASTSCCGGVQGYAEMVIWLCATP